MAAHTLGNPFDLDAVLALAKKHDLWLVEDNCDALGSTYRGKLTGSFGDFGTLSFYPAHHITMGEGGAVLTNRPQLKLLIESFRDWGRDCWCEPGEDDTCGLRFDHQLGSLPRGYDHKYIYSHIGYNLKVTDMQAAVGVAQLAKLSAFVGGAQAQLAAAPRRARALRGRVPAPARDASAATRAGSASRSPSARRRRSTATSSCGTSRSGRSRPGSSSAAT